MASFFGKNAEERYETRTMLVTVSLLILLVLVVQSVGDRVDRK